MSDRQDQIAQLRAQLEALAQIQTQEDFDEGARLHMEHNAPWVNGPYSHLKFPPYVHKSYPKMLFNEQYEDACKAYEAALMLPGRGMDDAARSAAIVAAERAKTMATKIVQDAREHELAGSNWHESPVLAVEAARRRVDEKALGQAHREYEDRNMGEAAKREAAAFDDAAEDFTPTIPEKAKRGRPKKAEAVPA